MTKKCTKCGNTKLAYLYTLNLKVCTDCGNRMKWALDKGQKPLLTNKRANELKPH